MSRAPAVDHRLSRRALLAAGAAAGAALVLPATAGAAGRDWLGPAAPVAQRTLRIVRMNRSRTRSWWTW